MNSSVSSIRNGLRSSSLISLLARSHGDLKASRTFSTVPPKFGHEENLNHGVKPFDNASRTTTFSSARSALSSISNSRKDRPNGVGEYRTHIHGALNEDGSSQYNAESSVDFVHIKILRNNSFVTVTDSKGNKKFGFSSGSLPDRAGAKYSRFSAEAASEHVGRMCRSLGTKSVVIKVNGHIHFRKKKQAIMSWMEGYTNSRTDQVPVVSVEDNTRKPHNGCRRPRARRS